jgi:hypothetical protein
MRKNPYGALRGTFVTESASNDSQRLPGRSLRKASVLGYAGIRKPEADGSRQGRGNFQRKIIPDRIPVSQLLIYYPNQRQF